MCVDFIYFLHLLRILVFTSVENLIIFVVIEIRFIHMWMFCMLYVYMHVFNYVYACLYVYQCVSAPVFLYMCVPVCVLILCMHICMCVCVCTHVCVYTRVCARARLCAFLLLKCLAWDIWFCIFFFWVYLSYFYLSINVLCIPDYFIFTFNFLPLLLFASSASLLIQLPLLRNT